MYFYWLESVFAQFSLSEKSLIDKLQDGFAIKSPLSCSKISEL